MPKPKPAPRRVNTRKLYERHHQVTLSETLQVHHKLPLRLGGTDDISNLEALTAEEHSKAHLDMYKTYGDVRDLCAHYMILGMGSEALKASASRGGKASARYFKSRGLPMGFQDFDPAKQKACASAGGKIGGKKQLELGLGIHAQTREQRLALASLGGKKGAEKIGWKNPEVQSENGKRGGVKNKGFVWVNDGQASYKFTPKEQVTERIEDYLSRTGRAIGRIAAADLTCPHCKKVGKLMPMKRWHFNNCKEAK